MCPQIYCNKTVPNKNHIWQKCGTIFLQRRKVCNYSFCLAVGQVYQTRVSDVFVIIGNDALVSCSLPSFASEFLSITSWVTSNGHQIMPKVQDGKFL
jgi:hypothetical protein